METPQSNNRVQRGSFLSTLIDTAGAKGIILTSALLLVTALSYMFGPSSVQGPFLGAVLTAALVAGEVLEDKILETEGERVDKVGVSIIIIAAVYTGMEFMGMSQGYTFPLGAGTFLFGSVLYDYWESHSGSEDKFDLVEFLGSVDITGLYGSEILYIYTLLYVGGQTSFLFTPHFPALIFVFMVSVFGMMSAYMTPEEKGIPTEGLHNRLISVLRSLEDIEDPKRRREIATEVRPLSDAISGVKVPSKIKDVGGNVPIVLPTHNPMKEVSDTKLGKLLKDMRRKDITGYAIDSRDNVVFFKNGKAIRYYLRDENEFGHNPEDLDPESWIGDAKIYSSTYSMIDSVEAITPNNTIEEEVEEHPRSEEAGEIKNVISEKSEIGGTVEVGGGSSEDMGVEAETASGDEEKSDSEDSNKINLGGNEVDIDEMFEKADEILDE